MAHVLHEVLLYFCLAAFVTGIVLAAASTSVIYASALGERARRDLFGSSRACLDICRTCCPSGALRVLCAYKSRCC